MQRFDEAMAKLEKLQQGDFDGIFEAMDGLPVVIRLIDPPLHEFLPNHAEVLVEVTRMEATGVAADDPKYVEATELLRAVEALREQNPMLGLRGIRLGPDDPRPHQDADAGHPQRRHRAQAGTAATRTPRS